MQGVQVCQTVLTETNSSHLKMDGWNTSFLLGWPIFRLVSGAICIKLNVQLVPYYSADFDEFNELPAVNPSAQKSHPSYVTI